MDSSILVNTLWFSAQIPNFKSIHNFRNHTQWQKGQTNKQKQTPQPGCK